MRAARTKVPGFCLALMCFAIIGCVIGDQQRHPKKVFEVYRDKDGNYVKRPIYYEAAPGMFPDRQFQTLDILHQQRDSERKLERKLHRSLRRKGFK